MDILTDSVINVAQEIVKPELLEAFIEKYKNDSENTQASSPSEILVESRKIIRKAFHKRDINLLEEGLDMIRDVQKDVEDMENAELETSSQKKTKITNKNMKKIIDFLI